MEFSKENKKIINIAEVANNVENLEEVQKREKIPEDDLYYKSRATLIKQAVMDAGMTDKDRQFEQICESVRITLVKRPPKEFRNIRRCVNGVWQTKQP